MGRRGLVGLVIAGASLWAVAPAGATIVWQKGAEIWQMRDDGTSKALLLKPAHVDDDTMRDPHLTAAGSTLVFSATENGYRHYGTGVYRYSGRALKRLSPWDTTCTPSAGADYCLSGDYEPELTTAGQAIFEFSFYEGDGGSLGEASYIQRRPLAGGSATNWGTACSGAGNKARDPSPNPTNANQIVYTSCNADAYNTKLIISGPNRAGEKVIVLDDKPQRDPSWSPDGAVIVTAEDGGDSGLWFNFVKENPVGFRQVLVAASGKVSGPRFVGSKIVFSADGELWSIPATCNRCAYPGAATKLTTDGSSVVDRAPAWTSAALLPAPNPGTASVVGSQLRYVAAAGVANDVALQELPLGSSFTYYFVNDGGGVKAGTGCTSETFQRVRCSGTITSVRVETVDGNDVVTNAIKLPVTLVGGDGNDTLTGGAFNDVLDGGKGADILSGLGGVDTVTYAGRTIGVVADIDGVAKDDGSADDGAAGARDTIKADVENLTGGNGNDTLSGSALVNLLIGGPGADTLFGLAGNDDLRANDNVKDTKIDCGAGTDKTIFDSGLDPAPLGCETATNG